MRYEIGRTYEFEVNHLYGEDEDVLRLMVPDVGEVHLPKMRFQQREPLPDRLRCRIKAIYGGAPVLSHFVPDYVNRFYGHLQNSYSAQNGYEFKVIGRPEKDGAFYTLEDKYGIRYRLYDSKAYLGEGQRVMCRFDKLTPNFFSIRLVEAGAPAQLYGAIELLLKAGVKPKLAKVMSALMRERMEEATQELDRGEPLWVVKALREAVSALSQWYVEAETQRKKHPRTLRAIVAGVHRAGLYLLERSRFIRNLDSGRRRALQGALTEAVDSLEPIARALDIAAKGTENLYIENLQSKLSESGYLYHPTLQLSVLMLILRRKPGLVRTYLGSIFDTIMAWPLDTWVTEPFRSAFTGQLEIYIRQASHEIDLFPQADTEADNDRIEKTITALALQMLIGADGADSASRRRNRSLFYRYVSLQRPIKSNELLEKSLHALLGVRKPIEFSYDTIRQPQALMTSATLGAGTRKINTVHRFKEGNVELSIGPDGLSLRRTDEDSAPRTLPNGMMDWLQPQIFVSGVQGIGANQANKLDAHGRMWSSIEKCLLEHRQRKTPVIIRRNAEVDDDVLIVISPQMIQKGDNPGWQARIDDENFEAETGWISREDIVGYNLNSINIERDRDIAYSAFVDEHGQPRHFLARVSEVDANGQLHFSLLHDISQQLTEIMNDYDCYTAVIAYTTDYGYSAIAETGYGIYLQRRQEDDYKNGDIVRFHLTSRANPGHISGVIDGFDLSRRPINKVHAFANLLKAISVNIVDDSEDSENQMLDADESLTKEDLREIVELIRFKAIATSNLLTAYDYLMLGRIIALVAADEKLAKRLLVHAELLRMHQFYATNRRIDADELERWRPEVDGYPLLEIVFHRLELVSWLGDTEHNADLWETINNSRNHLETSLAQLVLSYNMLPAGCEEHIAEALKKQIAQTLGLNFEVRQLKSYGSENQFTEFKSSLVYPARKKNEKVAAEPETQQFVILKTIAAFMNSEGGTLYIGVNDKTHCEAGLFEDFEYYKHYRPFDGKIYHQIKNADNLCVFLTNLICNKWGNVVAGSVQVDIDQEAQHEVIIVNVKPRTLPVYLDNMIYVRRSNNSKALQDRELEEFTEERKLLAMSRRRELDDNNDINVAEEELKDSDASENVEEQTNDNQAVVNEEPSTAVSLPSAEHKILTSSWRENVLHNWEEGYVEPAGYIYFGTDNTFLLTNEDRSYDYNEDCRLALAFSTNEASQGYLMMVFDNNRILKVPMVEILEKDPERPIAFYKDSALKFVTIAYGTDAILAHVSDSKNNLSRRVVPLSEIESAHLTSTPELLIQMPGISAITACEIASASSLDNFKGSMSGDLSSRQLGYLLHAAAGTEKASLIFKEDCQKCRPQH